MPITTPAANYTGYPNEEDVTALLEGSGFTVPSGLDVLPYVYAAIDEFESETGYRPFLAGASATYLFDPPGPNFRTNERGGGRRLLLNQAFATISAVRVGVTSDSAGTLLTENTDYYLRPANHAANKIPITEITFVAAQWGPPGSITVVGTPGYFTTIRAEVWNAIRDLAGARYAQALKEGTAYGNPVEIKEGDVSERYSLELLTKLGDTWRARASRTIIKHRFIC